MKTPEIHDARVRNVRSDIGNVFYYSPGEEVSFDFTGMRVSSQLELGRTNIADLLMTNVSILGVGRFTGVNVTKKADLSNAFLSTISLCEVFIASNVKALRVQGLRFERVDIPEKCVDWSPSTHMGDYKSYLYYDTSFYRQLDDYYRAQGDESTADEVVKYQKSGD